MEFYCLSVLEAKSLKYRRWQGRASSGTQRGRTLPYLLVASDGSSQFFGHPWLGDVDVSFSLPHLSMVFLSSHHLSCVSMRVCVQISFSYKKDTGPMDLLLP